MQYGVRNSVGVERVQISETNVDYPQKILFGPVTISTCFIPAHVDGSRRMIAIPVDPQKSDILSRFVNFDTEIRRQSFLAENNSSAESQKQVGNIYSSLKPSYSYLYLGFDKRTDNLLGTQVRILEHRYSVKEALRKFQSDPYKTAEGTDNTKMHLAPVILMTVIVLRHSKDPTKPAGFMNTAYTVTPILPVSGMQGYFDIAYGESPLDIDFDNKLIVFTLPGKKPLAIPINAENYKHPIFTDEELAAMQACNIDLQDYANPFDDSQIIEKLMQYPIDINAVRDGLPYFPHKDQLIEKMQEFRFNFIELTEKVTATIPEKAESTDKSNNKKSTKKESDDSKVEDAEYTTVSFGADSKADKSVPDTVTFSESDEQESDESESSSGGAELPDFMNPKKNKK